MGRHSSSMREPPSKPKETHPIWRGIGCVIIIIVPILSYALAYVTLPTFFDLRMVPSELSTPLKLPDWVGQINQSLAVWLQSIVGSYGFLALVVLSLLCRAHPEFGCLTVRHHRPPPGWQSGSHLMIRGNGKSVSVFSNRTQGGSSTLGDVRYSIVCDTFKGGYFRRTSFPVRIPWPVVTE